MIWLYRLQWNVITSSDDSGDTKIISINYEESNSNNDSPNTPFATTYRAAMAAEDSSRTTYTTYKCPVSNTARAKTDQCTNWTISPVSVKTTSKVSKEVVEMSGTIVKTSTSETRETKEETFYTCVNRPLGVLSVSHRPLRISHDQKLWKLTGGNAGDVVRAIICPGCFQMTVHMHAPGLYRRTSYRS